MSGIIPQNIRPLAEMKEAAVETHKAEAVICVGDGGCPSSTRARRISRVPSLYNLASCDPDKAIKIRMASNPHHTSSLTLNPQPSPHTSPKLVAVLGPSFSREVASAGNKLAEARTRDFGGRLLFLGPSHEVADCLAGDSSLNFFFGGLLRFRALLVKHSFQIDGFQDLPREAGGGPQKRAPQDKKTPDVALSRP